MSYNMIHYTAILRMDAESMGFTVHKMPSSPLTYIIKSISSDLLTVSTTPEAMQIMPDDEIRGVSLYSSAKSDFFSIDVSDLLEMPFIQGLKLRLDLCRVPPPSAEIPVVDSSNGTAEGKVASLGKSCADNAVKGSLDPKETTGSDCLENAHRREMGFEEEKDSLKAPITTTTTTATTAASPENLRIEIQRLKRELQKSVPKTKLQESERKCEELRKQLDDANQRLRAADAANQRLTTKLTARKKSMRSLPSEDSLSTFETVSAQLRETESELARTMKELESSKSEIEELRMTLLLQASTQSSVAAPPLHLELGMDGRKIAGYESHIGNAEDAVHEGEEGGGRGGCAESSTVEELIRLKRELKNFVPKLQFEESGRVCAEVRRENEILVHTLRDLQSRYVEDSEKLRVSEERIRLLTEQLQSVEHLSVSQTKCEAHANLLPNQSLVSCDGCCPLAPHEWLCVNDSRASVSAPQPHLAREEQFTDLAARLELLKNEAVQRDGSGNLIAALVPSLIYNYGDDEFKVTSTADEISTEIQNNSGTQTGACIEGTGIGLGIGAEGGRILTTDVCLYVELFETKKELVAMRAELARIKGLGSVEMEAEDENERIETDTHRRGYWGGDSRVVIESIVLEAEILHSAVRVAKAVLHEGRQHLLLLGFDSGMESGGNSELDDARSCTIKTRYPFTFESAATLQQLSDDINAAMEAVTAHQAELEIINQARMQSSLVAQHHDQFHQSENQFHQSEDQFHQSEDKLHQLENQLHQSEDQFHQPEDTAVPFSWKLPYEQLKVELDESRAFLNERDLMIDRLEATIKVHLRSAKECEENAAAEACQSLNTVHKLSQEVILLRGKLCACEQEIIELNERRVLLEVDNSSEIAAEVIDKVTRLEAELSQCRQDVCDLEAHRSDLMGKVAQLTQELKEANKDTTEARAELMDMKCQFSYLNRAAGDAKNEAKSTFDSTQIELKKQESFFTEQLLFCEAKLLDAGSKICQLSDEVAVLSNRVADADEAIEIRDEELIRLKREIKSGLVKTVALHPALFARKYPAGGAVCDVPDLEILMTLMHSLQDEVEPLQEIIRERDLVITESQVELRKCNEQLCCVRKQVCTLEKEVASYLDHKHGSVSVAALKTLKRTLSERENDVALMETTIHSLEGQVEYWRRVSAASLSATSEDVVLMADQRAIQAEEQARESMRNLQEKLLESEELITSQTDDLSALHEQLRIAERRLVDGEQQQRDTDEEGGKSSTTSGCTASQDIAILRARLDQKEFETAMMLTMIEALQHRLARFLVDPEDDSKHKTFPVDVLIADTQDVLSRIRMSVGACSLDVCGGLVSIPGCDELAVLRPAFDGKMVSTERSFTGGDGPTSIPTSLRHCDAAKSTRTGGIDHAHSSAGVSSTSSAIDSTGRVSELETLLGIAAADLDSATDAYRKEIIYLRGQWETALEQCNLLRSKVSGERGVEQCDGLRSELLNVNLENERLNCEVTRLKCALKDSERRLVVEQDLRSSMYSAADPEPDTKTRGRDTTRIDRDLSSSSSSQLGACCVGQQFLVADGGLAAHIIGDVTEKLNIGVEDESTCTSRLSIEGEFRHPEMLSSQGQPGNTLTDLSDMLKKNEELEQLTIVLRTELLDTRRKLSEQEHEVVYLDSSNCEQSQAQIHAMNRVKELEPELASYRAKAFDLGHKLCRAEETVNQLEAMVATLQQSKVDLECSLAQTCEASRVMEEKLILGEERGSELERKLSTVMHSNTDLEHCIHELDQKLSEANRIGCELEARVAASENSLVSHSKELVELRLNKESLVAELFTASSDVSELQQKLSLAEQECLKRDAQIAALSRSLSDLEDVKRDVCKENDFLIDQNTELRQTNKDSIQSVESLENKCKEFELAQEEWMNERNGLNSKLEIMYESVQSNDTSMLVLNAEIEELRYSLSDAVQRNKDMARETSDLLTHLSKLNDATLLLREQLQTEKEYNMQLESQLELNDHSSCEVTDLLQDKAEIEHMLAAISEVNAGLMDRVAVCDSEISSLSAMRDKLQKLNDELDQELSFKRSVVSDMEKSLQETKDELSTSRQRFEEKESELRVCKEAVAATETRLTESQDALDTLEKDLTRLRQENIIISGLLNGAQEKNAELDAKLYGMQSQLVTQQMSLQQDLVLAETKLSACIQQSQENELQMAFEEETVASLEKRVQELRQAKYSTEDKLAEARLEIKTLQNQLAEMNESSLAGSGSRSVTLRVPAEAQVVDMQRQLVKLSRDLELSESERFRVEGEKDNLDLQLAASRASVDRLIQDVRDSKMQTVESQLQVSQLNTTLQDKANTMLTLSVANSNLQTEVSRLKDELQVSESANKTISAELRGNLKDMGDRFSVLLVQFESAKTQLAQASAQRDELEQKCGDMSRSLVDNKALAEEMQLLRNRLQCERADAAERVDSAQKRSTEMLQFLQQELEQSRRDSSEQEKVLQSQLVAAQRSSHDLVTRLEGTQTRIESLEEELSLITVNANDSHVALQSSRLAEAELHRQLVQLKLCSDAAAKRHAETVDEMQTQYEMLQSELAKINSTCNVRCHELKNEIDESQLRYNDLRRLHQAEEIKARNLTVQLEELTRDMQQLKEQLATKTSSYDILSKKLDDVTTGSLLAAQEAQSKFNKVVQRLNETKQSLECVNEENSELCALNSKLEARLADAERRCQEAKAELARAVAETSSLMTTLQLELNDFRESCSKLENELSDEKFVHERTSYELSCLSAVKLQLEVSVSETSISLEELRKEYQDMIRKSEALNERNIDLDTQLQECNRRLCQESEMSSTSREMLIKSEASLLVMSSELEAYRAAKDRELTEMSTKMAMLSEWLQIEREDFASRSAYAEEVGSYWKLRADNLEAQIDVAVQEMETQRGVIEAKESEMSATISRMSADKAAVKDDVRERTIRFDELIAGLEYKLSKAAEERDVALKELDIVKEQFSDLLDVSSNQRNELAMLERALQEATYRALALEVELETNRNMDVELIKAKVFEAEATIADLWSRLVDADAALSRGEGLELQLNGALESKQQAFSKLQDTREELNAFKDALGAKDLQIEEKTNECAALLEDIHRLKEKLSQASSFEKQATIHEARAHLLENQLLEAQYRLELSVPRVELEDAQQQLAHLKCTLDDTVQALTRMSDCEDDLIAARKKLRTSMARDEYVKLEARCDELSYELTSSQRTSEMLKEQLKEKDVQFSKIVDQQNALSKQQEEAHGAEVRELVDELRHVRNQLRDARAKLFQYEEELSEAKMVVYELDETNAKLREQSMSQENLHGQRIAELNAVIVSLKEQSRTLDADDTSTRGRDGLTKGRQSSSLSSYEVDKDVKIRSLEGLVRDLQSTNSAMECSIQQLKDKHSARETKMLQQLAQLDSLSNERVEKLRRELELLQSGYNEGSATAQQHAALQDQIRVLEEQLHSADARNAELTRKMKLISMDLEEAKQQHSAAPSANQESRGVSGPPSSCSEAENRCVELQRRLNEMRETYYEAREKLKERDALLATCTCKKLKGKQT